MKRAPTSSKKQTKATPTRATKKEVRSLLKRGMKQYSKTLKDLAKR